MAGDGGKNRKYNTKRKWCESYKARYQREKNKYRKIMRHLKKYPNDEVAKKAADKLRMYA